MDIRKNKDDKGRDALELLISGRVDGAGAIRLYDELQATLGSGTQTVYINMAEVTFLCSAGLAALINFSQKMWKLKRVVRIARPSAEVETVLRTSGLYEQLIEKV
jgi:anti-anti-sigma factor